MWSNSFFPPFWTNYHVPLVFTCSFVRRLVSTSLVRGNNGLGSSQIYGTCYILCGLVYLHLPDSQFVFTAHTQAIKIHGGNNSAYTINLNLRQWIFLNKKISNIFFQGFKGNVFNKIPLCRMEATLHYSVYCVTRLRLVFCVIGLATL